LRLVFAIVTFVAASIMLAFGIGTRVAPEPPRQYDFSVETQGSAPLTIVDGATLTALAGRQTVTISHGPGEPAAPTPTPTPGATAAAGAGATADQVVAAYGRRSDVMAWVGDASYNEVAFRDANGDACAPDPEHPDACTLQSIRHGGSESAVPDPYGADLWIQDYQDTGSLSTAETIGPDLAFLIATDGTAPAPSSIEISWPTPPAVARDVAAWLIIGGAVLGVIGLVLLLSAIHRIRGNHGPKRKMPKVPRRKTIKTVRSPRLASKSGAGLAIAAIALGALAFAPAAQPASADDTPTPNPTATEGDSGVIPAVDERQIRRIVQRVVATITSADSTNDAKLVSTRLTGPALELKTTDYALLRQDSTLSPSSPQIPADDDLVLSLPQQVAAGTPSWPRTVFAVVAQQEALGDGATAPTGTASPTPAPGATAAPSAPSVVAPVAMVLQQDTPRDNYKAVYLVALQADIPEVPAAEVGTALLSSTSPLVAHAPDWVTPAYVDILTKDSASEYYADFDIADDRLVQGFGVAAQQAQQANQTGPDGTPVDPPNQFAFATAPGNGPLIALATTDGGAIVTGTVRQTADVTPGEEGAKVIAQGDVHLLSGVERSDRGYTTTYAGQMLFYIPPLDSSGPVRVLGYAAGIVASKERP